MVVSCILVLIALILVSSDGYGQIKISDRKTSAYKESRKNKNKKKKARQKRYRKASIKNQTSGELEVVPEALKERYVPNNQNVEKNPSRAYSQTKRKQRKKYAKKANESKRQGMASKDTYQYRQRKYKKQSKSVAQHQGNIRVDPYVLRGRAGLFPQPPVDDTPGRTNIRRRNEKLAQYSQKSEEALNQGLVKSKSKKQKRTGTLEQSLIAQSQGLYRATSKKKRDKQIRKNSNIVSSDKGNLSISKSRKDDIYMAKSVERLNQGMSIKNKALRDRKQLMQSSSLTQSQYQGNLKYTPDKREDQYMMKSIEGQKQGMVIKNKALRDRKQLMQSSSLTQSQFQGNLKYTPDKREDQYMMKSIESQKQGMVIKNKALRDRKQLMQSSSLTQSQYQGNLKLNAKKKDDLYMMKSIEAQKQGMVIKNKSLRDSKQLMQSNSMAQSQFQGNLKFNARNKDDQYMVKSIEAQNQGMVIKNKSLRSKKQLMKSNSLAQSQYQGNLKLNQYNKDDIYMGKSVEMLSSGLTIRRSDRKKEAMYIRKSIEASNVGLYKIKGDRNKEDIYMGKSVEMLSQGLYKGQSIQDRESLYIRKSIEMMNVGLMKVKSKSNLESQLKKKSNEAMSYSGDLKFISERERDTHLKKASIKIYSYKGDAKIKSQFAQNWYFKRTSAKHSKIVGDFKVQNRFFERMHYARLSARHKKFTGTDEESRFEHWWASLWKRPMDQKKKPEPLRKPRYDSKEHEIWFD